MFKPIATALAFLAATLLASPAQGHMKPGEFGDPSSGPGRDRTDPAVVSLVEDYEISPEQAIDQLWNQLYSGRSELQLPASLREGYGGRAIDHGSGGAVTLFVVSSSDAADEVIAHFSGYGIDPLTIREVEHSDDDMVSIASSLASSLRNLSWEGAHYDVRRASVDKIEVRVERSSRLPDGFAPLVAKYDPALVEVVEVAEVLQGVDEACDWTGDIECDPPLRGSVKINQDVPGPNPVCTAGYNVRSLSDDLPYVLFPGHCTESAAYDPTVAWETQFEDESVHLIGTTHNAQDNANHDAGILRVNNPVGWQFGQAIVTVDPTPPPCSQRVLPGLRRSGCGIRRPDVLDARQQRSDGLRHRYDDLCHGRRYRWPDRGNEPVQ